jgi:3-hydroxymyristoyl/3-hydroxydecanoyl-(acyl carrier protein) dehydratase
MAQRNRTSESPAADLPRLDPEILEERRAPDRWEQDLRVPADLGCWPGHFPDRPILPGVLQLDWAMQLLARWLGGEAWPRRVEGLKFKQFIRPGQALTLVLEREAGGGSFRFRIAHGATTFSLGRIVVEDAGNVRP